MNNPQYAMVRIMNREPVPCLIFKRRNTHLDCFPLFPSQTQVAFDHPHELIEYCTQKEAFAWEPEPSAKALVLEPLRKIAHDAMDDDAADGYDVVYRTIETAYDAGCDSLERYKTAFMLLERLNCTACPVERCNERNLTSNCVSRLFAWITKEE